MVETIAIEWAEIKDRFTDSVRHGKRWDQPFQAKLRKIYADPYTVNDWAGGSGAQALGWLDDGYNAPEFALAAQTVATEYKPRTTWSEEDGDVDLGRMLGGYDDFYLGTAESEARPGLKVTADCFFAASVPAQTVADYGAWVAGVIGSLEARGFDLEISLAARVTEMYVGRQGRTDMEIRVKRPGELSDFTEWSALFSPIGVRWLVFTGFGVAAASVGKQMTSFCSCSLPSERFGVTYDAETNHLRITAAQRSSGSFPGDAMSDALGSCGI
jgi:hypothetical protein